MLTEPVLAAEAVSARIVEPKFMPRVNRLKYPVVTYWDKNDKVYISVIPDLPGCQSHGKTALESLKNAGKATDLWLETAREFGDEIPKASREINF